MNTNFNTIKMKYKNYETASCKIMIAGILTLAICLSGAGLLAQTFPTPTGFTLPAGKNIVITYKVTVNPDACPTGSVPPANISNQSNVSGSNFATVQTDEVAGAPVTPTLTPFGAFTLGNLVYNDVNRNGTFDAGDSGINGVSVNLYLDNGDNVLTGADGAAIANSTTAGGGLYSFNVCPGSYIVEIAASNFNPGGALHTLGTTVSSPITAAPDPDNNLDNDDNGEPVAGFGVASQAVTISASNSTVDFAFKVPSQISIGDMTLAEGSPSGTTTFAFNVTRPVNQSEDAVTLTVNTNTGTADGSDFTAISGGSVMLGAGVSSAPVNVSVTQDIIVENNETFTVTLSAPPSHATLADASGAGSITNDDAATVTIAGPSSQFEGNAGTTTYAVTLTLDNPVQDGFMITSDLEAGTAACCGVDFSGPDVTFTFMGNAGETKTTNATIFGDLTVELDETFTIALTNLTGAPAGVTAGPQFTGTITNDDAATISFSSSSGVSQSEASTPQVFTVTLSNPVDVNVIVDATTTDALAETGDLDYTGFTGQDVQFNAGTTTAQLVNVAINNDNKVEANETYTLGLSNVQAGGRNVTIVAPSLVTGTIQNDDSATVTLSGGGSGAEGNSGMSGKTFTATLNNPVQGGFDLAFTTNNGSANAGSDYVDNDNTLTFSGTANEMETITVNVNSDFEVENNETFTVNLGAFSNTTLSASLSTAMSPQMWTIVNDEVDYGDAPTAAQSGFPLTYKTTLPDTAAFHTAVLGIHLGATIDGEANGQPTATANGDDGAFLDDEDGVTLPTNFITGTTQSITVNASVAGFVSGYIDWSRNGYWSFGSELVLNNVAVVPGNNTFNISTPAGASVGTSFARFRFRTTSGLLPPANESGAADGEVEDYQVSIINNQYSISSPTLAAEGNASTSNLTFVVSRISTVNAGSVDYAITGGTATSGADYLPLAAGTINFTAGGNLSENVVVQVIGDLNVEDNETIIITLSNPVSGSIGTSPGTGTIDNDDTATLTLTGGDSQGEPQTPRAFNAQLSAVVQGGFKIAYTTNNGTTNPATAGSDYTDNDSDLTFAGSANETQTVNVIIANENTVELNETFTVVLGAFSMTSAEQASSITIIGGTQTETILNDDGAVVNLNSTTVSQSEGTGNQTFTVTLSNPVDVPVTVDFIASDNTALEADNDYEFVTSQPAVTFPANTTTSQTVAVTVNNDFKVEPDEIFNVTINNLMAQGRNVAVGAATGSGTIVNDDSATLTLTGGGSGNEGNSGTSPKVFTATLSNPVQNGFTLNFTTNDGSATTADSDYANNDGSIAFAGTANEMQTITVNVNGDFKVEANENFTVNMNSLSNTSLGSSITLSGSPQTWTIVNDEIDFGDAPTSAQSGFPLSYKTVLPDSVARHTAVFGIHLGATIDGEVDGQPTATANGDDATTLDDEDGVTLPTAFITGTTQTITVNASAAGFIYGWIDWTRNGYWSFSEQVLNNVPVMPGNNTFNISTPAGASVGTSFARFRYRTASGPLLPADVNVVADGEVEDYQVLIQNTTLSINDVTQVETNASTTTFAFTVSLTNPAPAGGVTFDIATADGTAQDGNPVSEDNDYVQQSLTGQTIPMGSSTYTFNVTVNGDVKVEPNETFFVNVTNVTGVSVTDGQGQGTISNDDMATLTLSGGSSQTEGTSHTFTATLSHAVQGGFMVAYTTNDGSVSPVATLADSDYTDNDNTLTFTGTAGEFKTFTVLTGNDNKVELDETFTVALGTPSAANVNVIGSPQTGTITNNDQAIVSITNVSQAENLTPQVFSVSISNPVDVAVSATANTSNGTATTGDSDYSAVTNQTVTFATNTTTSQTVNVTISNDNKVEDNEVYSLILSTLSASGRNVIFTGSGSTLTGTGTIQNDDSATLTLSGGTSQNEGNTGTTPYVMNVALTNPVQGGFTIAFNTNDITTTAGSDYIDNDATLTFSGTLNESKTITVNVNGDHFVESDEQFTVTVASNIGNTTAVQAAAVTVLGSPQTNTIVNDEVDYGDAPDTYATLIASNGARHNTVLGFRLGSNLDGDADGQPNATGSGDDTDAEGDDDDGVTLPAQLIATTSPTITVNASASGKLDAWIDFNGNGSFADAGEKVFNNVSLVTGNNTLTVSMPMTVFQGLSFARFRFSSAGGLSFNGLATDGEVEDYQILLINTQFSINDTLVTEGNAGTSNLTFTISRSTNGNACSVDYAITGGSASPSGVGGSGGADYQPLAAGTASFTAGGAFSQTVSVVVNGDLTVELNETVVMTLSNPVGGNILDGSGTGTINNDDAATVSVGSPSITEGNSGTSNLTFNITMSNPADANVDFTYVAYDGTATQADNDYSATGGAHTMSPGQTTKTVDVPIVGDCKIEANEMFLLTLGGLAANGRNVTFSGGGGTTSGTGTITNDDALPGVTCPGDFNQNTDPNVCNANVTLPLPTLSSICGSSTLEFRHRQVDASNNPTGAYSVWIPAANNTLNFAKGRFQVEWRITDGSGVSTCSHYFNVVDNQAPVAVCKNITVQLNSSGNVNIIPAQVNNGSSDNCAFALSLSKTSFNCTNVGPNTVTLTATDPGGLTHTCTATVTVKDLVAPVAQCKPATVFLNPAGQASVTAAQVNNNSTDACGIQSLSVAPNTFTCSNLGANTVTLTVTDVNNNSATCTATVTVADNLPPTVACTNISISLGSNGYASITSAQVFNAAGSSDNCSAVNPQSVSPNIFDCSDIGANTVTLTGNDGHGNTSTCQATVTVAPFITNIQVTVTPSNCNGSDGIITITAQALGGQLRYSINNFVTFNLTGVFTGLAPGTYPIAVMAAGTSGCQVNSGTVTVGTTGTVQTWYKDVDGDDYSDGNSQVSCSQPANYYLASSLIATTGDCDDNDPLAFPGQVWYKDQDNDGYSNGSTLTQCLKPVNYKALSQLISPPTGLNIDCNDNNASIKPGATEICNNIDDDCDGQVDEGTAGGLTWVGNVTLNSQTGTWNGGSGVGGVNNFPACYSVIQGNLTIENATVNNLAPLANLVKVVGNVTIKLTSVVNMNGLHNMDTIGGNLTINNNNNGSKLNSLDGLEGLDWVSGTVKVYYNFTLTDCCAIEDLVGPEPNGSGPTPSIYSNAAGCNNTSQIIACPGFAGGGGGNNSIVTPDQPCPDCPSTATGENWQVMALPNPASVELTVEIEGNFKGGTVGLTDLAGRELLRRDVLEGETRVTLQLDEIGGGLYFLQVRSGTGEVRAIRVVIAK